MQFQKPLFIIPEGNRQAEQKTGGGGRPKFHGEINDFELHKRRRVEDVQKIINSLSKPIYVADAEIGNLFFEIELSEKALSKSAQPKKLLEASKIDLYGQRGDTSFLASCSRENFESFRDSISKISLTDNRYPDKDYTDDSAYLSAITGIRTLSKEEILVDKQYIKEGEAFTGYIYFYDGLSQQEAQSYFERKIKDKSTDSGASFFISSSGAKIAYGSFDNEFLDQISEPDARNPIQRIEKSLEFTVSRRIEMPYNVENIEVAELELEAKVVVFDSGIQPHSFFDSLILGHENYVNTDSNDELGHGTFVGTRTIFGNDIHDQLLDGTLRPKCKLLDVKIFGNEGTTNDKDIVEAVKKILSEKKYSDIRVMNLSLNSSDHRIIHDGEKHFLTRELDALSYIHQVLFIVSAGNHHVSGKKPYPECLLEDNESVITPPADIINGISVGSIADLSSTNALAKYNEPSPFSRVGLIGALKKPDLVHFGGNVDKYGGCAGIGAKGFSNEEVKILESCGTSFSAPLVSQIAAQIYGYLLSCGITQSTMDLVKALLIHSARYSLPQDSKISESDLHRLVGFGLPDYNLALDSARSSCTFMYVDELINFKEGNGADALKSNKHKIKFTIPKEFEEIKNKSVKVRGTLVYTPQVSISSEIEYSLAEIKMTLHHLNSKNPELVSSGTTNYQVDWNPIKQFEKDFSSFQGGEWEIWLSLNTRGIIEDKEYKQPYALVVSIEDTSKVDQRLDLHELIRTKYPQYNMLTIKQRVRT